MRKGIDGSTGNFEGFCSVLATWSEDPTGNFPVMELLGSWFIDMESWEVDEGRWGVLTKMDPEEGSWRLTKRELVGFGPGIVSGQWDLGRILGSEGAGRIGRDRRGDLPPVFSGSGAPHGACHKQPTSTQVMDQGLTFLDSPRQVLSFFGRPLDLTIGHATAR